MSELSNNDYKNILEYYKKPIPKSSRLLKLSAKKILATKLCKCIKKVDLVNESRSIGICTKTIINRKGFRRGKFKCKGNATIKITKIKNNNTRRK